MYSNSRLFWAVAPGVAVLVVLAFAATAITVARAVGGGGYELDPAAQDGVFIADPNKYLEGLQEQVDDSAFRIQINAEPVVDAATQRGNFLASNPAENKRDIQVSIYLVDTGQEVYRSRTLKPGERIPYDILGEHLEPGVYDAAARMIFIDEDGQEAGSNIEVEILLTVE
ncbi:MAG: hypothetical protein LBR77_00610 [Lachnospiraceae bacterium]|jgi:hypothetical protein|nr:hypothetical protein [Lachnospiraceae bacterium]